MNQIEIHPAFQQCETVKHC